MSIRYTPEHILSIIRSVQSERHLQDEASRYVRAVHVVLDHAKRQERISPDEELAYHEASEWFAHWYGFDISKPIFGEVNGFIRDRVFPRARRVMDNYGLLASAATQFGLSSAPFRQAQFIIHRMLEGI